jgi:Domain of unknown function (DUF4157)
MARSSTTKQIRDEQPQLDGSSQAFRSVSASYGTILALQRAVGNEAVGHLLRPELDDSSAATKGHELSYGLRTSIQTRPENGLADAPAEQQADCAALSEVQRRENQPRPLVVADDVAHLEPGQMRKNDFLDALKTSVSRAAEGELKGTIWSSMDCTYIERWFSHNRARDSRYLEAALKRYAPEAAGANNAREYIPILTERVRRGIAQWTQTADTTGVPKNSLRAECLEQRCSEPLDPTTQTRIGEGLGPDFNTARIHTERRAAQSPEQLIGRAFTIGEDFAPASETRFSSDQHR